MDLLRRSEEAVICVQAPGGYGKTTVLAQWAAADDRPFVWVTVRPQAPDTTWLVYALLASLARAGLVSDVPPMPATGDAVEWYLSVLPLVERSVGTCAVPCVVVIDEAGAMGGPRWESLVASVAASLPPGSQLVLATRDALPASLTPVACRGDLCVVDSSILAFDTVEAADLARAAGADLSDADLLDLMDRTEGWPVAVYLSLLGWRRVSASASASHQPAWRTPQQLTRYLGDEIVDRLAPQDSMFLLRCSVLTELDEATCIAVTGDSNALARLSRLAESNHLVTAMDPDGRTFRLHPLLSEALSHRLRVTDPRMWRECHCAASLACEAAGDLDAAVYHARTAGDDTRLGNLVWRHTPMLLDLARSAVLERWMAGLDRARLTAHPGLALASGWVGVVQGDLERVRQMTGSGALATVREGDEWEAPLLLLRATVWNESGVELEQQMRRYLDLQPSDDPWLTVAHLLLGTALVMQDRGEDALAALTVAHDVSRRLGLPGMSAQALAALAQMRLAEGGGEEAMSDITQARWIIAHHGLEAVPASAPVLVACAVGHLLSGRPREARDDAMESLRLLSRAATTPALSAVFGRLGLAKLLLALGDVELAAGLVREVERDYPSARRDPGLERALASVSETLRSVRSVRSCGVTTTGLTAAELRLLQHLPTRLTYPQIAAELYLSPHTIKSQSAAILRKLGAHDRNEAIRRAQQMGLLAST